MALVQPDLKRLVAYSLGQPHGLRDARASSSSHEQGLQGAILQMINHGLITGALFLLVGVIYERTHDRTIAKMGGLAGADAGLRGGLRVLRVRLGRAARAVRASSASSWSSSARSRSNPCAAAIATFVMILAAGYLLWMYQRIVFGELSDFLAGPRRPPDRHDPGRDPDPRRRSARWSSSSASSPGSCSTSFPGTVTDTLGAVGAAGADRDPDRRSSSASSRSSCSSSSWPGSSGRCSDRARRPPLAPEGGAAH